MKKSLLAILFMVGSVAFAQPDIEVKLISPANNASIVAGTAFNFDIRVINRGTVAIDAMDSIIYAPVINGSLLGNGAGGVVVFLDQTPVPVGDSITLTQSLNISGGSSGMLTFCGTAVVTGAGWDVSESDTTNNLGCNMVNYTTGSVGNAEFTLSTSVDESYYAGGIYHVELANYNFSAAPVMRVYNITGVEVFSTDLYMNSNTVSEEVNLSGLKHGVYVVQIVSDSKSISTKKIVVN